MKSLNKHKRHLVPICLMLLFSSGLSAQMPVLPPNQPSNINSSADSNVTKALKRKFQAAMDGQFPKENDRKKINTGSSESFQPSHDTLQKMEVTIDQRDCSAAGKSDGEATIQVNIKPKIMTFRWKNMKKEIISTTPRLTGVGAGTYDYSVYVEILDECTMIEGWVTIDECKNKVDFVLIEPTTSSDSNGSIEASIVTGTSPYTYRWGNANKDSINTLSNVGIGTYQVTITDARHCVYIGTVELFGCDKKKIVVENKGFLVAPPSNCEAEDGNIRVVSEPNASGGVVPYTYQWQDEEGNPLKEKEEEEEDPNYYPKLINGTYFLVATDAQGCKGKLAVSVRQKGCWESNATEIHAACAGNSNGFIRVYATQAATWTWSNGSVLRGADVTLNNLKAGTYSVTATYGNYEPIVQSFEVPSIQITPPISIMSAVIPNCPRKQNGKINLAIAGGISPYASVSWSDLPNQSTQKRDNLAAGIYTVKITDYCGSTASAYFALDPLSVSISTLLEARNQGTMTATASGGVPPYTYLWDNGATTATATGLTPGGHSVTVKDAVGCAVDYLKPTK